VLTSSVIVRLCQDLAQIEAQQLEVAHRPALCTGIDCSLFCPPDVAWPCACALVPRAAYTFSGNSEMYAR